MEEVPKSVQLYYYSMTQIYSIIKYRILLSNFGEQLGVLAISCNFVELWELTGQNSKGGKAFLAKGIYICY